jgi:adhesin transport system outer membrane protein
MQSMKIAALVLSVLFSGTAMAQAQNQAGETQIPQTLKEAAQAAVLKSPEVQARWHAFREADEEIDVGRGGFLPKIDLSAGVGRYDADQKRVIDGSWSASEASLSLQQMIFDGFSTVNDVKRLGKAKLVR